MIRRPPVHRARADALGTTVPSSLHRHDELARLVGDDGAVGHQDRVVSLRARDADAAELAGRQEIRIGEDGAGADRAGAAIDLIVDEV